MADEARHDFQLNGKELVFLFMAATVVVVVVFLCGVMVGRGVHAPGPGAPTMISAEGATDPTASAASGSAASAESLPSPASGAGDPPAGEETLTYTGRLESPEPADETLAEPAAPQVRPAVAPSRAAAAPASAPAQPAPAEPVAVEPPGPGFVVQVAAPSERGAADTIVRRLTQRGYPAFITTPASGPRRFRVRVGKYKDRREAESVANRLEKEEQFKPWITR